MFTLENKTILMVIAHPDDEVIFGWPILQNPNIKKKILCCSSDLNNPDRVWCKNRKLALEKICTEIGVEKMECLDYNSEFYRLQTRNEELKRMTGKIISNIEAMRPFDFIYTHNFWGEYGHLDHILVNNICFGLDENVVLSDILLKSNWICDKPNKFLFRSEMGKGDLQKNIVLNHCLYDKLESIYRGFGVWTWSQPPAEKCSLKVFYKEEA